MRLSNAKLAFLSCVILVFVAGYARSELAQLYSSIINFGSGRFASDRSEPAEPSTPAGAPQDSAGVPPAAQPPAVAPDSSTPTPQSTATTRTEDIGRALEGVGPGGLDQNLVNQRQEYLKNLNSQLQEQHGGVLPTTTSTTQAPDEDTPASPDLLPQNIPNMSVPGSSPPGWTEPPPMLTQTNPAEAADEADIEDPEVMGEDDDLEPEPDEDDDSEPVEDEEPDVEEAVE